MAEPTNQFSAGETIYADKVNENFEEAINDYRDFTLGETISANTPVYLKASDGKIYKTSSTYNDERIHNFMGILKEGGDATDIRKVQITGKVSGLSGLTAGSKIYLNDTAGTYSSTAGAYMKMIGVAVSTTELSLGYSFVKDESIISMIAGETINGETKPVPVFLYSGYLDNEIRRTPNNYTTRTYFNGGTPGGTLQSTGHRVCQSFNTGTFTKITKFSCCIVRGSGKGTSTIYWALYAVDGNKKPTGEAIASGSQSITEADFYADYDDENKFITPAEPIAVSASTVYTLVIWRTDNISSQLFYSSDSNAGDYYCYTTTDSGANWSEGTRQIMMSIYGYADESFVAGRVYASKANTLNRTNFIGFAITNATAGNTILVQIKGVVSSSAFSLVAGVKYFVGTTGDITTGESGNAIIYVGKALTAKELLIEKDDIAYNIMDLIMTSSTDCSNWTVPINLYLPSALTGIKYIRISAQVELDTYPRLNGTLDGSLTTISNYQYTGNGNTNRYIIATFAKSSGYFTLDWVYKYMYTNLRGLRLRLVCYK